MTGGKRVIGLFWHAGMARESGVQKRLNHEKTTPHNQKIRMQIEPLDYSCLQKGKFEQHQKLILMSFILVVQNIYWLLIWLSRKWLGSGRENRKY